MLIQKMTGYHGVILSKGAFDAVKRVTRIDIVRMQKEAINLLSRLLAYKILL